MRAHATPARVLSVLPELRQVPWPAAIEAPAPPCATNDGFDADVLLTGVRLDSLIALFAGPAVAAQAPDGMVATRSQVSDPAALRAALRKVAPRLPGLAESLIGTPRETVLPPRSGPSSPSLPAPGKGLLGENVKVERIRGERDLYRLESSYSYPAGLPRPQRPIPIPRGHSVFFGVVGDAFVVADGVGSAKEIAAERPSRPAELAGAVGVRGRRLPGGPC